MSGSRKSRSFTRKQSSSSLKSTADFDADPNLEQFFEISDNEAETIRDWEETSNTSQGSRRSQSLLTDAGFSRNTSSGSLTNGAYSQNRQRNTLQPKITHYGEDPSQCFDNNNKRNATNRVWEMHVSDDSMLAIDVRIEGKLYRVPVKLSEKGFRNIKWLAEEAAKRYCR